MIAELNIKIISISESIRYQLVSVLVRRLDAFAVEDDYLGHIPLKEDRFETGNGIYFRQRARPVPYARRIFIERGLNCLLRLGFISMADLEECHYASPLGIVGKKDVTLRYLYALLATQPDADQRCLALTPNR